MSDQENENVIASLNKRQNEFNVIRARIDTSPLLQQLAVYLRGYDYITVQVGDEIKQKRVILGLKKANDQGIQSILSWVQMTVNNQVVQGNFPRERSGYCRQYEDYCYYFQVEFGDYLMTNLPDFEISENEYLGIIHGVMNLVRPFMTRLIDNLERDSYGETTKSIESSTVASKSGFNFFKQ